MAVAIRKAITSYLLPCHSNSKVDQLVYSVSPIVEENPPLIFLSQQQGRFQLTDQQTVSPQSDDTPLGIAAKNGHTGIVRTLMSAGANIHHPNKVMVLSNVMILGLYMRSLRSPISLMYSYLDSRKLGTGLSF